jgi:glycosyltransferase involved in cell wall biosynthesis
LVIAGKKGWLYTSIFKKVQELRLEDKIIFTDYLPEEDKPALIAGAKVFCLPSFWEGFGLDVLNAMACGVCVVVSNSGSLPEVAGEAGIYVDPNSSKSISDGINKVLSMDNVEYNRLVEKGLAQVKKFSWEKTAKKTLEALEDVPR